MDEQENAAAQTLPIQEESPAPTAAESLPAEAELEPQTGAEEQLPGVAEREAALQERERAIAVKERHFKALEMLEKRNLPQNLIDYIDLDNDDSLRKSIELAARARTAPGVPEAPEAAGKPPRGGSYEEYRRYYSV